MCGIPANREGGKRFSLVRFGGSFLRCYIVECNTKGNGREIRQKTGYKRGGNDCMVAVYETAYGIFFLFPRALECYTNVWFALPTESRSHCRLCTCCRHCRISACTYWRCWVLVPTGFASLFRRWLWSGQMWPLLAMFWPLFWPPEKRGKLEYSEI